MHASLTEPRRIGIALALLLLIGSATMAIATPEQPQVTPRSWWVGDQASYELHVQDPLWDDVDGRTISLEAMEGGFTWNDQGERLEVIEVAMDNVYNAGEQIYPEPAVSPLRWLVDDRGSVVGRAAWSLFGPVMHEGSRSVGEMTVPCGFAWPLPSTCRAPEGSIDVAWQEGPFVFAGTRPAQVWTSIDGVIEVVLMDGLAAPARVRMATEYGSITWRLTGLAVGEASILEPAVPDIQLPRTVVADGAARIDDSNLPGWTLTDALAELEASDEGAEFFRDEPTLLWAQRDSRSNEDADITKWSIALAAETSSQFIVEEVIARGSDGLWVEALQGSAREIRILELGWPMKMFEAPDQVPDIHQAMAQYEAFFGMPAEHYGISTAPEWTLTLGSWRIDEQQLSFRADGTLAFVNQPRELEDGFDDVRTQPEAASAAAVAVPILEITWGKAVGGAGLAAALVAAFYYFAQVAKSGIVTAFTRIRRHEVLEHPARAAIVKTLRERPGLHFQELLRACGLAAGQGRHHVAVLEGNGLIHVRQVGANKLHFVQAPDADQIKEATATHPTSKQMLGHIRMSESISVGELADHMGLARSTVSHHVARLRGLGLVQTNRLGRKTVVVAT